MQESGLTGYGPYPRRLECLTICHDHNKCSTLSSFILKTPSVDLVKDTNPQSLAQQSSTLQPELTRWQ